MDNRCYIPGNRVGNRGKKKAGCLCVEMECAAALAVTKFRGVPFAQFLYGADNLDSSEWEPRDLTEYGYQMLKNISPWL